MKNNIYRLIIAFLVLLLGFFLLILADLFAIGLLIIFCGIIFSVVTWSRQIGDDFPQIHRNAYKRVKNEPPNVCPECGEILGDKPTFCKKCGKSFKEDPEKAYDEPHLKMYYDPRGY